MEWIDVLLGGFIAWSAVAYGRRYERKKAKRDGPQPICGCKHHYSMHDATGACQHVRGFDNDIRCTCQRYTGPEPLPEYFA